MVFVEIFGIDPYMLRQVSRDLTPKLAKICETDENSISFYAPEGLLVHNGVEQNAWNITIKVFMNYKYQIHRKEIIDLLVSSFSKIAIHITVAFTYHQKEEVYGFVNSDYPLFLTENNIVDEDDEEFEDDDVDDLNDVFSGNAFEGFEDKLK